MRQWACVIALLLGFAGDGYVWAGRVRIPVAIERSLGPVVAGRRTVQTLEWWRS